MANRQFRTVVDAIETACGNALTPKLFGRRRKFTAKERRRIAEAHYNYETATDFRVPERAVHEVFPYVHPQWLIANLLGSEGYKEVLTNEDSAIKALLLYYHRIALPDGFSYLCDRYRLAAKQDRDSDAKFDAYLRLFASLRALIQEGIVTFLPEEPTVYRARDAVRTLPFIENFEEKFPKVPYPVRGWLEESLWVGKSFDLDLMLPTTTLVEFFTDYNRFYQTRIPKTKLREATLGPMLLATELPQLEMLSVGDIVAVRKNDEGFSSWRRALRNVLQTCYADYSEGKLDDREFARIAHEEMAEGRARVVESIKNSHYLNLLQAAVKSVGVGVFATAISSPTTLSEAATKAIAAAGATFLWDYAIGKKKERDKGPLRAHYAVFDTAVDATSHA